MPKTDHRQCHYTSDSSSYSSDDDSEYTCRRCKKRCSKCEKKKQPKCSRCNTKHESERQFEEKERYSKCKSKCHSKHDSVRKVECKSEEKPLDICDEKKNGNYIIITIK